MKSFWARPLESKLLACLVLLPLWWLLDRVVIRRRDCWAFFVHPIKGDQFIENVRAVFEEVKADPLIHKVIFARTPSPDFNLDGSVNTRIVQLQSLAGLLQLTRCGVFLLTNAIALDMSWRWRDGTFSVLRPTFSGRVVVNLWHGIPLKRLFSLTRPELQRRADRVDFRKTERAHYSGLICSSDVDSYAMAASFQPIPYERLWLTGLPRNDFLLVPSVQLPVFLRKDVAALIHLKAGRRLVTYAPTFRESGIEGAGCYQFSDQEIEQLKSLLRRHDAVLGFRMHYFRKGDTLFNLERYLDGEILIDLGHRVFQEVAPVMRETDLLITDYSSLYLDALYLDRPVLSFAYDLDHYRFRQNGLLYDMELAFPGPVVRNFSSLLVALDQELSAPAQVGSERYRMAQQLFFKFRDAGNSQRVVSRLHALLKDS
jgi:CDP-glycerol glycerophosphotransferase